MNGAYLCGAAFGVGVGWLNATILGLPGWVNIVAMLGLALLGTLGASDFTGE